MASTESEKYAQVREARSRLAREYAPVAMAVCFGLAISVALRSQMETQVTEVARYDFSEESKACISAIERSLLSNIELVRWLGATVTVTPTYNRAQFEDLIRTLIPDGCGAMALQWIPRVPGAQRSEFESSTGPIGRTGPAIVELGEEGELVPAGERAEYFPLLWTPDDHPSARYTGFDLGSDPEISRYLALAADKGTMFFPADGPFLHTVADGGAVLALCPVYSLNDGQSAPGERRAELRGFTAGLIQLDALFSDALRPLATVEVDLHVFDFFAEPGKQLLYYRPGKSQSRSEPYVSENGVQLINALSYVGPVVLGTTRRWLVACTPAPDYAFGIQSWSPLLGLALGLAFTFLVAYHFYANIRQRRAAEELVHRRTAELKRTNENLVHEVAARKHFELERDDLLALLESTNVSLQQLNSRLERSNQDLQDFAMVASHDLKEPLRKVRVLAESLRDKWGTTLSEGAREYLDLMESALQRMHNLITNLLQVSRVSTHGQPFIPVDVGQVVSDVISDLAVRVEETHGTIAVGPLPTIQADPLQMRQFVQNILDNGLKYHRDGVPPHINVHAVTEPEAGGQDGDGNGAAACCTIIFEDNGIGFAPEYSESVFTLFQRLDNGARVEGSGVGLAVCRKIAERHGGTIRVQSEAGKGSTFTLTLPVSHNGT